MYCGPALQISIGNSNITQSFKAAGVAIATLSAVKRFSGDGSLVGESAATLVGSLGNVGTFATATGESIVTVPLFNQHIATFGTATGESIDNNSIGVGTIVLDDDEDDTRRV